MASLVILEGLLSVDNAMVLAVMVKHLPEDQQNLALRAGYLGAVGGRCLMLLCASFIIQNPWLKLAGGAYLIWMMVSNLGQAGDGEEESEVKASKGGFWATVFAVEMADLAFSIDNVAAAVAMSDKLWAVFTGVAIGILAMRFVAGWFIELTNKYPILEPIAYLLVGYVGALLVLEEQGIYSADEITKFIGIFAIIGSGLAYSQFAPVKTITKPVVNYVGQLFGNVYELTTDVLAVKRLFTQPVSYVREVASDVVELAAGLVSPVTQIFVSKPASESTVDVDAETIAAGTQPELLDLAKLTDSTVIDVTAVAVRVEDTVGGATQGSEASSDIVEASNTQSAGDSLYPVVAKYKKLVESSKLS